MDVIVDRCAGLDVHKRTVVACVRTPGAERRKRDREVRTFETFTDDLVKRFHSAASGLGLALDGTGRDDEPSVPRRGPASTGRTALPVGVWTRNS